MGQDGARWGKMGLLITRWFSQGRQWLVWLEKSSSELIMQTHALLRIPAVCLQQSREWPRGKMDHCNTSISQSITQCQEVNRLEILQVKPSVSHLSIINTLHQVPGHVITLCQSVASIWVPMTSQSLEREPENVNSSGLFTIVTRRLYCFKRQV